jgi:hypothetical protein
MAQAPIILKARVKAGHRIEFFAPELAEGEEVEISVTLPATSGGAETTDHEPDGVWDFIRSLKPRNLTPAEWEQTEQEFRQERDACAD